MPRFTIFGAPGFIGRNVSAFLRQRGHEVLGVGRSDLPPKGASLGHAIYCVGLTANFRSNLNATARAHVCVLCDILDDYSFESFLYVSSTRVYMGLDSTQEDTPLTVDPRTPDHVYNLSKLTGESLCLARSDATMRVARVSNVVGPDDGVTNFLPSLIDEARRAGEVVIRTSSESAKDYVDVNDVCAAFEEIALAGRHRLYNVAAGRNVSNGQIARLIESRLGARVRFQPGAHTTSFAPIRIERMKEEFAFAPASFETSFERLAGAVSEGCAR